MTTLEIKKRIAELSEIIMNCTNDHSVASAVIWLNAIREREKLLNRL